MDKPLAVSDKSQPWKFVVAAVFAVLLVLILLAVKDLKPKGNNLGFSTITSRSTTSTVQVVGTSSTLIVATSTGPHFICNTGLNEAFVAFANSITTSTGGVNSNGMLFTTSSLPNVCNGPFDYIGVHAAHTKTGTTSIEITVFP